MIRFPYLTALAAACLAASATHAQAQSFHLGNGTNIQPLVTLSSNHFVGGLDVDSSGNLFYFDVDGSFAANSGSHLYERTAAGVTTDLFDFSGANGPVYASFVRLHGGEIFWGESSTNTLWRATLGPNGQGLLNPRQFGQFLNNYDVSFSLGGNPYLSANTSADFSNPNNQVYRLSLGTAGTLTTTNGSLAKIDAGPNYSGPLVFGATGNLYYGSSNGGIYRFLSSEVATNSILTLDDAHKIVSNAANAYLTVGNGTVFQDSGTTLTANTFASGFQTTLVGTTDSGFSLANLAFQNGEIYVSSSKYLGNAYIYAVPEPASAALLTAGGLLLAGRRRRRA